MYFINNNIKYISNNEDINNPEFVDENSFNFRYMNYCNSTFYKFFNISLSVLFFIYYNISLYFYLKNRKHYLIKNKQVLLCVTISCICEVFCVLFPLTKIYTIDCWR
ncbi:hypothetical protein H8356DRAFT_460840 [Neocallimastix lanati (nom. inval.)]|nr:hypothetical protein H8356DRAFT_460840 [Neocallimastix sp. JGI-2020a]